MSKKENVVDSARELFSQYGYSKVSMNEIAKKAGVTKKTIYSYFKDKNNLVKYFLDEELLKIKNIIESVEKENISFTSKIHKTIIAIFEFKSNSKLLCAFEKDNNTYCLECLNIVNDVVLNYIKNKLDSEVEKGCIKECDTDFVAFIVYKVYTSLLFEWDKPLDNELIAKNTIDMLQNGLLRGSIDE